MIETDRLPNYWTTKLTGVYDGRSRNADPGNFTNDDLGEMVFKTSSTVILFFQSIHSSFRPFSCPNIPDFKNIPKLI